MKTDLFKFMALRAPDSTAMLSRAETMIKDERPFEGTAVGGILAPKVPAKSEADILKEVRALIAKAGYALEKREPLLQKLHELVVRSQAAFDAGRFAAELKQVLGGTPAEFVAQKEYARISSQSWDKLQAFFILKRVEPINLEGLLRDLRLLHLVKALAGGRLTASAAALQVFGQYPAVIPPQVASFTPAQPPKPADHKPAPGVIKGYDALWNEFGELYRAQKELRTVKWEQKATVTAAPVSRPAPISTFSHVAAPAKLSMSSKNFQLAAPAKELTQLSAGTRAWLAKSRLPEGVVLPALDARMNADLAAAQSRIHAIRDPAFFERLPRTEEWAVHFHALANFILYPGLILFFPTLPADTFSTPLPAVRPLGVGDLKVVKQTFQKYTASEIAHIENVLKGELKERKHRRLNRSEEITTTEEELVEETEHDTQKTDRFELKLETERTIETDMRVQAGLTVSASYGPVSIGARADFAYTTSSSETSRSSSNFAREIVDRSIEKIQKKAREERVRKLLNETEETNLHVLDNKTGAGNVSGIYRWVDKHYTAQVYNYGRRLMFEFIVPEPAAYLRFARNAAATPAETLPPLVPLGNVTHRDIHDWNYHEYIQRYQVQGILPPPPLYTTIAVPLGAGDLPAGAARAETNKEINVPQGYVARYWTGRLQWSNWNSGDRDLTLIVGNGNEGGVLNEEDTNVPVALHLLNVAAYAATIEVHCERTPRRYEEWQLRTFEKISAAYRAAAAERENRGAAVGSRGVVITGQNPRANRDTERNELKKNCVSILSNQFFGSFDAMRGTPPEINIPESLEEGRYIQFFEQAFEWEQVTYLFYPYFWGRKAQWASMQTGADPDPLFDQFLKAGAARVLVPVHPMYNDAILYYLSTGRIWNGGETPRIGDPLFLALYEELRSQQDDLEGAVPEGEPWNVVVPTSLVHLQADFSLQTTNAELNPPAA